MADQHIDIERMIMQAHYKMQLEAEMNEDDATAVEPLEKKPRDLSNRPDHYNTMHADICVIHDCDLDKLKEMGLEFIRYTRPVDQFDRVSLTRQDRYLYVWVRDKNGNEFPFFLPKSREDEKRECVFVNESKYDTSSLVPHTSATYTMLSDLGVNRFQYALSSGRELYRMFNEKMCMSKQSILNWLTRGAELLEGGKKYIKEMLLKKDTSIYCDETWVWTKALMPDGTFKYVKRYIQRNPDDRCLQCLRLFQQAGWLYPCMLLGTCAPDILVSIERLQG